MTARNLVLFCTLVVAGCSVAGCERSEPVATTTITSVRPDCAAIADNVCGLATELRQLVTALRDVTTVCDAVPTS